LPPRRGPRRTEAAVSGGPGRRPARMAVGHGCDPV